MTQLEGSGAAIAIRTVSPDRAPMNTPWRRRALTLAVMAAVASSCSATDQGTPPARPGPADPIPVSVRDVVLAGEPIADGFTVPKGSVLAGGPLWTGVGVIYKNVPVADRGWRAELVVSGDPRQAIEELRQQAKAAGFELRPASHSVIKQPETFCDRDGAVYECLAVGLAVAPGDQRSLTIEMHRRPGSAVGDPGRPPTDEPNPVPESHMVVTYADSDRPFDLEQLYYLGPTDAGLGPAPPAVPAGWGTLPTVGERFGEHYTSSLNGLKVEPGTRLIIPTSGFGCMHAGYAALLAIDGNPTKALDRYVRQAAALQGLTDQIGPDGPKLTTYKGGGHSQITMASIVDSYSFRLVQRPHAMTLLYITACGG